MGKELLDRKTVRSIMRRFSAALTVSFLIVSSHLRMWLDESNRLFNYWDMVDKIAWALVLIAPALIILITYECLGRRKGKIGWLLRVTFTLLVFFLFFDQWPAKAWIDLASRALWPGWLTVWLPISVLYCCVAVIAAKWAQPVSSWVYKLCLLFSPIVLIVLIQMVFADSYGIYERENSLHNRDEHEGNSLPSHVFLIIFDEWSFARTWPQLYCNESPVRMVDSRLPYLNSLVSNAVFCTAAYSPGGSTMESIPELLYIDPKIGEKGRFANTHVNLLRLDLEKHHSSIFDLAKAYGYRTSLTGFHLPYGKMFPQSIDRLLAYPFEYKARRVLRRIGDIYTSSILNVHYPVVFHAATRLRNKQILKLLKYSHLLVVKQKEIALKWCRESTKKEFVVLHLLATHSPYSTNPDCSYRGEGVKWKSSSISDYETGLRTMDGVLGAIVEEMKKERIYDSSTIIITSDHSWRHDPLGESVGDEHWRRHVPLLIKCPSEDTMVVVTNRVDTRISAGIIKQAFAGGLTAQQVSQMLSKAHISNKCVR